MDTARIFRRVEIYHGPRGVGRTSWGPFRPFSLFSRTHNKKKKRKLRAVGMVQSQDRTVSPCSAPFKSLPRLYSVPPFVPSAGGLNPRLLHRRVFIAAAAAFSVAPMEFWGNLSIPVHALQNPTIACCDLMGFLCSSDILGPIRVTIGFSLYVVLRSVQHGFLLMFYHLRVRIYLFCAAVRPLDYFPCLDDM